MGQQVRSYQFNRARSGSGERVWLSMLVETMDRVSQPSVRELRCDAKLLSAFRLQLDRPSVPHTHWHDAPRSDLGSRG
jgi:hypothetical protein